MQSKYVRLDTVARHLDISTRTVRRLIDRGDLIAIKITPGCLRVDWQSVLDFEVKKRQEAVNE